MSSLSDMEKNDEFVDAKNSASNAANHVVVEAIFDPSNESAKLAEELISAEFEYT